MPEGTLRHKLTNTTKILNQIPHLLIRLSPPLPPTHSRPFPVACLSLLPHLMDPFLRPTLPLTLDHPTPHQISMLPLHHHTLPLASPPLLQTQLMLLTLAPLTLLQSTPLLALVHMHLTTVALPTLPLCLMFLLYLFLLQNLESPLLPAAKSKLTIPQTLPRPSDLLNAPPVMIARLTAQPRLGEKAPLLSLLPQPRRPRRPNLHPLNLTPSAPTEPSRKITTRETARPRERNP